MGFLGLMHRSVLQFPASLYKEIVCLGLVSEELLTSRTNDLLSWILAHICSHSLVPATLTSIRRRHQKVNVKQALGVVCMQERKHWHQ